MASGNQKHKFQLRIHDQSAVNKFLQKFIFSMPWHVMFNNVCINTASAAKFCANNNAAGISIAPRMFIALDLESVCDYFS